MANNWIPTVVEIDTVNDDATYDSSNDNKNGGLKYTTEHKKVGLVSVVDGASGNVIELRECSSSNFLDGALIKKWTLNDYQINVSEDFHGHIFQGLIVVTLGGSSRVLIEVK